MSHTIESAVPELAYLHSRLGEDPFAPCDEEAARNAAAKKSLIDGGRDRGDENLLFRDECRRHRTEFAAMGLSEAEYTSSRRIDEGLDELVAGSAAEQTASEPETTAVTAADVADFSHVSLDGPAPEPGSATSAAAVDTELVLAPSPPPRRRPATSPRRRPARPGETLSPFEMMLGGRLVGGTQTFRLV